ncbi:MAG: energy-coupling factor ABC transporter ATP-binding protein [Candidatus Riflebacteria bacterium HGW-Riflebacteria-2]|jgi:energy-coupling factor transport system ATP-binding protein|nr:MAG: energy-coupling factor ABC transporter ATP-binding protein [Candidatus Riflebacteria bacterium HGW-Riflebacteria-2]
MIVFDQVSFWYKDLTETSFRLKEVSFSLAKGCINGIIGGNGSGKSTVARLMTGLMPVNSGTVTVFGKDPYHQLLHSGFLAGIIFQNPENQIVGATVEEDLAFGLENLGLSHAEMHCRIIETAARFGLGSLLREPVANLSGGQKQLLCIASVMVMEPAWVIFDEPTSHLDPWSRIDFWKIIDEFVHHHDLGVVIVSQLAEDLARYERILGFSSGSLLFQGSREEFKQAGAEIHEHFNYPEEWKYEQLLAAEHA